MVTSSPLPGTRPQSHTVESFQLPDLVEVHEAAQALPAGINPYKPMAMTTATRKRPNLRFIFALHYLLKEKDVWRGDNVPWDQFKLYPRKTTANWKCNSEQRLDERNDSAFHLFIYGRS
jgi:hypothetical protein